MVNKIKTAFYFTREFFQPASVGAYYDGKELYIEEIKHKPARLYIAVSHRYIYQGKLNLPSLSHSQIEKAVTLEALRLLSITEEKSESPIIAFFGEPSELHFIFQNKSFFENMLRQIPDKLLLCGVFPAGLALLSPEDRDGLYAVFSKDICEGIIIEHGKLKEILPATSNLAKAIIESYKGPQRIQEVDNLSEYFSKRAKEITSLSPSLWISFCPYKIQKRPQISFKLFIPFIIPSILLGAIWTIDQKNTQLNKEIIRIDRNLRKLEKKLTEIQKKIQYYKKQEVAKKELKKFKKERINTYALLKDITEALPEDAWIRRFIFNASKKELRLSGEANNALPVVQSLKKLSWVSEVKLSTVTRIKTTGKERFDITIKLNLSR